MPNSKPNQDASLFCECLSPGVTFTSRHFCYKCHRRIKEKPKGDSCSSSCYELSDRERDFVGVVEKELGDRRFYSNCVPISDGELIHFLEGCLDVIKKSTDYDS